jgi:hypothetical protein
MSEHELLTKLNGYRRTFVVHSNANPNAAGAVLRAMMGRSQQADRYFQLSEGFVSQIEPLMPDEVEATPATDQVVADFIQDWVRFLRDRGLPNCGLAYPDACAPQENTMRLSDLLLSIRDDGKGIGDHVAELRPDSIGIGLTGMRERAAELGGKLRVMNADPGTVVEISIPFAVLLSKS